MPTSEEYEQQLSDALAAAIAPFRNVLHKDRAERVIAAHLDAARFDEDWITYDGAPQPPVILPLALASLSPDTAISGDPVDITLSCIGTGFTPEAIIVFNGNAEPTTLVSDTEVTTIVKPSLFVVPAVCPVEINSGSSRTAALDFTFTEPVEE